MFRSDIVVLTAEQVLARSHYKKRTQILIRLLSEKAMTIQQIKAAVRDDPDYPTDGLTDEDLVRITVQRLCKKRNSPVFGFKNNYWFVLETKADSAIRAVLKPKILPSFDKPLAQDLRSKSSILTILLFNLLNQRLYMLGELMDLIRQCPEYDTIDMSDRILRYNIFNRLHKRDDLFARQPDTTGSIPSTNALWGVRQGVTKPTLRHTKVKKAEKCALSGKSPSSGKSAVLYALMRSRWIIRGWSLEELYEAVMQPGSGYQISPGVPRDRARLQIRDKMRRPDESRFEQVTEEVGANWRARWNGSLKVPKSPADWQTLTSAVLNDLGLDQTTPIAFAVLWENVRQYGHLFGWDSSAVKATDLITVAGKKQPIPPAQKKPRKAETRLTSEDRSEILKLQAGGMALYQIIEVMAQKYPGLTAEEEARISLITTVDRHL